MRREIFRAPADRARALLERAPVLHLATTTPEGLPVLRALDAAVQDDGIYFHGARAGEKVRCMGRPAVVSAEEVIAHVPSWMVDAPRACTASTFYRSVQVHGQLTEVSDPASKARSLEALMRRWQPEGGYLPLDAGNPLYAGELAATLVFMVPFGRIDVKEKLCQNREPAQAVKILAGLWKRGDPGDAAAIEAIRAASPALPDPPFAAAPQGLRISVAPGEEHLAAAVEMFAGTEGWRGRPREEIERALRTAGAWVAVLDGSGRLLAAARAVSDGRTARVCDLALAPELRGTGLEGRLASLAVDHPAVRCRAGATGAWSDEQLTS
jgi:nitroimidazol reductase NimA-like FMN-containing flavoprotein (pyridoxamine 5'-phosphate oxidase superfamily)